MVLRRFGVVQPLPLQIVRRGASPVCQGDTADPWIVEAGLLRAWTVDDAGRELVLDVLGHGDLVGEADGGVSAWTVSALGPGRLRVARPDQIGPAMAERSERLTRLAGQLAWSGVRQRVEARLVDLATRLGRPVAAGTLVPLRITQDDLAAMVGTTRESANRAVRSLLDQDRLRRDARGRYVVRTRLRAVAR
ncbi:MAG TPA: Crp/Fnr family transcriptional regulator [Actinomycetota bacterium]|jgi:CRP-like cAMP-binding protein